MKVKKKKVKNKWCSVYWWDIDQL